MNVSLRSQFLAAALVFGLFGCPGSIDLNGGAGGGVASTAGGQAGGANSGGQAGGANGGGQAGGANSGGQAGGANGGGQAGGANGGGTAGANGGGTAGGNTGGGLIPAFDAGRPADGGLPAWRLAMSQLDTLYNVSALPPSQADTAIAFPGGVLPTSFGANESYGWDVMSGYSSGALIEDQGPFGTLVFGTGGHTRLQNQLLSLTISADAPQFGWFQQPYFETSEVNGAELYFNRAEFDALPANRKTGNGGGTEVAMTQAWIAAGAQFPMGYEGWIFPRKLVTGQLGNNNPHGFRYMAPIYLPSTFTGTGAGAYLVVEAPQGPFAQSWKPEGSMTSHLVDPSGLWPSGGRKWPIWYKNTQTGAWSRLAVYQPDYLPYGFIRQHTAIARDQKRVYVSIDVGNQTAAFWYLDFSNGVAGATVSQVIIPTTAVDPNRNTSGAFTDGHPTGRHLWYWPDLRDSQTLIVQDLDQRTQYRVRVGQGLDIAAQETVGMQYDPVNNRIIVLQQRTPGVLSYRVINVPADPANAASYVVSAERVLMAASTVATPVVPSHFYSKARLHVGLGVIFVPQDRGPMLAFRPSL